MGQQLNKQSVVVASSKSHRNSRSKHNSEADLELDLKLEQELPATINLQIAEAVETATAAVVSSETETEAEVRQIIIKIQLAKMENGNDSSEQEQQQQQQQQQCVEEGAATSADALNANEKIVNVKVGAATGIEGTGASRTAGSSTEAPKTNERQFVNNNNLAGSVASASQSQSQSASTSAAVKTLKLHDEGDANEDIESEMATSSLLRRRRSNSNSSNEGVDYCEVLEPQPVNEMLSNGAQRAQAPSSSSNSCSRCHSNKASAVNAATGTTTTAAGAAAAATSKRRCCKCKFLDAYRGMRSKLESSISKDKKETATAAAAAAAATITAATAAAAPRSKTRSSADRRSTPPTLNGSSSSGGGGGGSSSSAAVAAMRRQRNSVAVAEPSTLGIWAAPAMGQGHWYRSYAQGDVIIRISSQPQSQSQFAVMDPAAACIFSSNTNSSSNNNNNNNTNTPLVHNIRFMTAPAGESAANVPVPPLANVEQTPRPAANSYGVGVTVHSQIDFMHCLVPDLERIINSSFYWGKMDRYEAERLLEGKPEGTFLLRDSAQEEFLFSVTFRKYGRSLHARIEQSGHKFSFDCHDPCVFAALTVTGLLEHYKDPSCVMFFEPCLTMPLHRRQTFSLQQLSRATIVSNTTYDGINQLELPGRLKSYLKEYHYKQKLRVKPCDAHTPAPFYTNI